MKTCGGCTTCCEVVSVKEIDLPPFTRCRHLNAPFEAAGPGCKIYPNRPYSCRAWSCVWITDPGLPDELRPDRCGVVIDPLPDVVRVDGVEKPCAQLWVRPGAERAFNENGAVHAAIEGLLDQVPVVLWRMAAPEPGGAQLAMVFVRGPDGQIGHGPPTPATHDLGDDGDRLVRAGRMMDQLAR
jgi:hypothetical protein